MIKRFKLKSKFAFLGSLSAAGLLIIVIFALNSIDNGLTNFNEAINESKKVQNLQRHYIAPLLNMRELSLSLIMAPNENLRHEINLNLNATIAKIDDAFAQLEDSDSLAMWHQYKFLVETTRSFIAKGFEEGAFINANAAERKQFYALLRNLEKLQISRLEISTQSYEKAQKIASEEKIFIIFVFLSICFFGFLVGFAIINNIVLSIRYVQIGLERFFKYIQNRHQEIDKLSIDLDTKDELGEMVTSINNEMETIQQSMKKDMMLIEEATSMVQEIKKGKLHARLKATANSEELNTLKEVMNEMMDNLELQIQQEINRRTDQEKLLIQQSKLATTGNMIANIAHQWRQPLNELNTILMYLHVRYMYEGLDEVFLSEQIEKCNSVTTYMSKTINDFQNFFKPSKTKEHFSIVEACQKAVSILHSSLKNNSINLVFEAVENIEVDGYPNEFSQAFLNILSNAKDVLIERKIENPYIHVSIKIGKKFVLIHVKDNGGGISNAVIDHIFEPYFTTKHAKQGTGIGLYMCKTIIEGNMNGIIKASNTEDGALFTIKILL